MKTSTKQNPATQYRKFCTVTYTKDKRIEFVNHHGEMRIFNIWHFFELGMVKDEVIARAILNPGSEVYA